MLTEAEALALVKSGGLKTIKALAGDIKVGEHKIDVLIRVKGVVKKGEDYSQIIWPAVPVLDILIGLADVGGCVQQDAFKAAVKLVLDGKAPDVSARAKEIKAWTGEAIKELAEAGKKTCSGKATASLTAEKIDAAFVPTGVLELVAEPVATQSFAE